MNKQNTKYKTYTGFINYSKVNLESYLRIECIKSCDNKNISVYLYGDTESVSTVIVKQ